MKKTFAHNPLLPDAYYVPDVEAHVFDGRLYLYGSYDICGNPGYCSSEYHVFSSENLMDFVDHGVSFRIEQATWYQGDFKALYAPDCAYRNGKYYLYYCVPDGRCGVAVSDSPCGPFDDIGRIVGIDGIDPAVFIDDDGQAYIYWGQFDAVRVAKLKDNMVEIIPDSIRQPLSVAEHGFHEGSSVKKINGKYYFIYTDTHRHASEKHPYGMATCLGYAVSDKPDGDFRYGGIIIDNYGCDPGTWNNHGSIQEFNGQWYVFYHRSTRGFEFSRRVCAEKITILDGVIPEVKMTSSGIGQGIPACAEIPGQYACLLCGSDLCVGEYGGKLALINGKSGDYAGYGLIRFAEESVFSCKFVSDGSTVIEIYLDGEYVGKTDETGKAVFDRMLTGEYFVTLKFSGDFSSVALFSFSFS